VKHLQRKRNENTEIMIDWFDDFEGENQYAFLSNFYVGDPIDMQDGEGPIYLTGEHAFAAYKARTRHDWAKVVTAKSPGKAKGIGREIKLRPEWERVKHDVMVCVLAAKFAPNRPEAEWLLRTGDALLVEGTEWQDRVWGVACASNPDKPSYGRNWLGRLLMQQRALLRTESGGSAAAFEAMVDIEKYTLAKCAPSYLTAL